MPEAGYCPHCGERDTLRHPYCDPNVQRLITWARVTEEYAEKLSENPERWQEANIYWGKAMGLRQAVEILVADR